LNGEGISDKTVAALSQLPNLQELTIVDSSLTLEGLTRIVDFPELKLFNIEERLKNDEVIAMLVAKEMLHKTSWAYVDRKQEKLSSDDEITALEFSYSPAITDATIDQLELTELKDQLQVLYLHNTKISDEGCLKLHDFGALTFVCIGDSKVTKSGVAELQKALPNCKIISRFPETPQGK